MIVRRVGPLSFAKITGVLYGLFGFLGAVFSVMSLLSRLLAPGESRPFGVLFGVAAVIDVEHGLRHNSQP
jgi:hypothetical protein